MNGARAGLFRVTDTRLLIGVLIVLSIVTAISVIAGPVEDAPALSVRSEDPDGAMALRLWLEQSGYRVREEVSDPIQLGSEEALFILQPLFPFSSNEAAAVRGWVRNGHTLIVAGDSYSTENLLSAFDVSLFPRFGDGASTPAPISQSAPVLLSPPFEKANAEPVVYGDTLPKNAVVHVFQDKEPVLVSFQVGTGTVWVYGGLRPFSNLGLADPGNARMVLNMLAGVRQGGTVAFEEAKHGFGEQRNLSAWLFTSPPGWGILLALGLTLVYFGLQGRRFGRAVPVPDERLRREPVEYIRAMANLFRRSGQRAEILKHYRNQFRRRLSERYAVDPRVDDIELVKTIVVRHPSVDERELRGLLARLSRKSISEAELVQAAAGVDGWLARLR